MSKKISDGDAKLLSKDEISAILSNLSVATGSQRLEFAEAYDYLKGKHESLVELNDSAKQKFSQITRISKNPTFELTDLFVTLIFFLVFSAYAALFIEFAYDYHQNAASQLFDTLTMLGKKVRFETMVVSVAPALIFGLIIPIGILVKRFRKSDNKLEVRVLPKWHFLFFASLFFLNTLLLLFTAFWLSKFSESSLRWLTENFAYLCFIVVGLVAIIACSVITMVIFEKFLFPHSESKSHLRFAINGLILGIESLDAETINGYSIEEREKLVRIIARIAHGLEYLYAPARKKQDSIGAWTANQLDNVRNNVLSLASLVYFPNENSRVELRTHFIQCLNILLAGDFDRFLTMDSLMPISEFEAKTNKRLSAKVASIVLIAAYLFLPIIVLFVIVNLFKIEIHPLLQTILSVFYIIWAAIGVISLADKVSPEFKEIVSNLLKTLIGK